MNNLIVLTKVFLKSGSNFSGNKNKDKGKSIILTGILVLVMVMSIGLPMGELVSNVYDTLASLQQQGIIIAIM